MDGVRTIRVTDDEAELRLDRWFRRHYPELTHGRLEKLLRTGQVRVDGGRVKASARLEAGQTIRVPPLGQATSPPPKREERAVSEEDAVFARSLVIHRDDDVLVLNKPAGLAVQGGPHTRGAGALYQELGTEVRRFACDSSVLDRPAGRRNAMRSQSHGPGVREEC